MLSESIPALAKCVQSGQALSGRHKFPKERFSVSDDFNVVGQSETLILCVPAVTTAGQRDGSALLDAGRRLAPHLRSGSSIIVETISERDTLCAELRSVLERVSGLKDNRDFTLSFAPLSEETCDPAGRVAAIAALHNLKSFLPAGPDVDSTNRGPSQTAKLPRVVPRRRMDRDLADALVNTALDLRHHRNRLWPLMRLLAAFRDRHPGDRHTLPSQLKRLCGVHRFRSRVARFGTLLPSGIRLPQPSPDPPGQCSTAKSWSHLARHFCFVAAALRISAADLAALRINCGGDDDRRLDNVAKLLPHVFAKVVCSRETSAARTFRWLE